MSAPDSGIQRLLTPHRLLLSQQGPRDVVLGAETLREIAVFFAKQGISPPVLALLAEPAEASGPSLHNQPGSAAGESALTHTSAVHDCGTLGRDSAQAPASPLSSWGVTLLQADDCPPAIILCPKPVTHASLLPVVDRALRRRNNKRRLALSPEPSEPPTRQASQIVPVSAAAQLLP